MGNELEKKTDSRSMENSISHRNRQWKDPFVKNPDHTWLPQINNCEGELSLRNYNTRKENTMRKSANTRG